MLSKSKYISSKVKNNSAFSQNTTSIINNPFVTYYKPYVSSNNKPLFVVNIAYYYHKNTMPDVGRWSLNRTDSVVSIYANVDTPKEAVDSALKVWKSYAVDDLVNKDVGFNYDHDGIPSLHLIEVKDVCMVLDNKYWEK